MATQKHHLNSLKLLQMKWLNQLLQNCKSGEINYKTKQDWPMNMEELEKGFTSLKPGKAIGLDYISTEQIMNLLILLLRNGYYSCKITA